MQRPVNGILLFDKPPELTSNQALQRVKRLFGAKKTGHTGCLDPIATGMLPLCFGEATKFSQFLLKADKTYEVTAKLGITTDTGDREGKITSISDVAVSSARLLQVVQRFIGNIEQIPPMFSAIKKDGTPLYELARRGIEVVRSPRPITIHRIVLQAHDEAHDHFTLSVHCSKGTYIRTLIEDIGRMLGCGAHVVHLRRTHLAPYDTERMWTLPELIKLSNESGQTGLMQCLLPIETALQQFPAVTLSCESAFYVQQGQSVYLPPRTQPPEPLLVRLMAEGKHFLGIGEIQTDGRVKPARLMAS
jgi:tRNA pseudouridine55 synthase